MNVFDVKHAKFMNLGQRFKIRLKFNIEMEITLFRVGVLILLLNNHGKYVYTSGFFIFCDRELA